MVQYAEAAEYTKTIILIARDTLWFIFHSLGLNEMLKIIILKSTLTTRFTWKNTKHLIIICIMV